MFKVYKFNCIEIYRNHNHLKGCTEKVLMHKVTPFLKSYHKYASIILWVSKHLRTVGPIFRIMTSNEVIQCMCHGQSVCSVASYCYSTSVNANFVRIMVHIERIIGTLGFLEL